MDELKSHLNDAPNESDIHDECTCERAENTEDLMELASEQIALTGRMTDDPVAFHKIMMVMIISNMIDFHMNVATKAGNMDDDTSHAWIRDAGKLQAVMNILTTISCGPDDPYVTATCN
jgi:hypothetical protein